MVMNPYPLTDPDGVVRAWACSRCHRVQAPTTPQHMDWTREQTERCCRCRDCKTEVGRLAYICEACRADEEARLAPVHAEYKRKMANGLATFQQSKEPGAAQALATYMSGLSEAYYCAGWLTGLEYVLWTGLGKPTPTDPLEASNEMPNETEAKVLRHFSDLCGGWIIFADTPDLLGETWVPMAEWLQLYEKHNGKAED